MTDKTPPAPQDGAVAELRDDPSSRKSFLRLAGAGAAGSLALLIAACGDDGESSNGSTSGSGSGTGSGSTPEPTGSSGGASAKGDLEILNYALTLEYLEADFYQQVIDSGLVKDPKIGDLAKSIGESEQAHVDALTKTIESLGGTPVKAPKTKFEPVLDKGLETVLMTAATVENLGAAAYFGQAGNIKNKDVLAAALSIHSVEARHAAALNELVGRGFTGNGQLEGSIPDGAFAKAMDMDAVLAAVKPYLA
jgi:rubrerythrin